MLYQSTAVSRFEHTHACALITELLSFLKGSHNDLNWFDNLSRLGM